MHYHISDIDIPQSVLRARIEILYKDILFKVGSDIRWSIISHCFSIFTDDSKLAEQLDFCRIDKFEYEKTVSIDDIQSAYVTPYTEKAEQITMTPMQFKEWLNSFR